MKSFLLKIKIWVLTHKKTFVLILIILAGITYGVVRAFSGSTAQTRYVLGQVERGNIISAISGTGQVSASNQIDVTSKTSGNITYLNAKSGQEVHAGSLIAQIDPGNTAYELETAKLSYDKLVAVDPDQLKNAQNTLAKAQEDLASGYTNARATLASSSTDMVNTISGVNDLLDGYLDITNNNTISNISRGYIEKLQTSYYATDDLLKNLINKYHTVSASTSDSDIEALVSEFYGVSNSVSQVAKYAEDAVAYFRGHEDSKHALADSAYTSVTNLVSKINTVVASLSSAKNSLIDEKRALDTAQTDLKKLEDGPDTLDLRAEELSVKQKQQAYADYFIRAPFDGIIASVDGKLGQNVTSGTKIATLITKQKIAQISLNEVDAAKIKIGQKATLTFDALPDLTISGEVIEVNLVGTVSQGVVNYTVKIGFDVDNDEVKPGMTVNANIITEMKDNVLLVPVSAVKTQNSASYVQVFNPPLTSVGGTGGVVSNTLPEQVEVTVGISDDTNVEILSGLTEGEQIVSRTISGTATTAAATTTRNTGSTVRLGGGGRPF